ncbi:MAG: hypothetical protein LUC90_10230 [Lachnospiraceae bacterium]|nr:hypothetical protein [Lachnospiraceae bacterium]
MDDNLLECPYCGEEQLEHEPEGISMLSCRTKCERCGRYFVYAVTVARHYESFRDDEHTEMVQNQRI